MMDDATRRQISAADPLVSTWLAANAGSGKTRVLTDRVARLLLRQASPQNILCLTYTKAAAGEMQNRLFQRLGKWAMLDDAALKKELEQLGEHEQTTPEDLARARTLFARAIETPGGLRIQTIHSFCASLLRRFPVEAGVSPLFREMDERSAHMLRQETLDEMADGEASASLQRVARQFSGLDLDEIATQVIAHAQRLRGPADNARIWQQFGLKPGFDEQALLDMAFETDDAEMLHSVCAVLKSEGLKTDRDAAGTLANLELRPPALNTLEALFKILLIQSGKNAFKSRAGRFPTKAVREAHPDLVARLHQFMQRVEDVRQSYVSLVSARKTAALHAFAAKFLPRYEARKQAAGLLDFDDLIDKAITLLSDPSSAQWVLFRLDGGIDHILVDEAQDTSPRQWEVIRLLAQEFGAGVGAREDVRRTIFVVGDKKQSIYSFQGADPRAFEEMKQFFRSSIRSGGGQFSEQALTHSFRSSPAILEFVDSVFGETGADSLGEAPRHQCFFSQTPGRVDIWPPVERPDDPEEKNWFDPTDSPAANDPNKVLAEKIAKQIKALVEKEAIVDHKKNVRRINCGDILILVQRRSPLFHEIIRACKQEKLPVAGADRLKVAAELAVKDLTALLSFLTLPEDDLSLAATLRSPLFGMSESELFDIAHTRGKHESLWQSLLRAQEGHEQKVSMLRDLRDAVDFRLPFDLLERILTRHDGRKRLVARLGHEAEDGIDALLSLALAYEQSSTPSLTGFLVWLGTHEVDLKREMGRPDGRIRVMTTHGAKGLESPIVILPDTAKRRSGNRGEFLVSEKDDTDKEFVFWPPQKSAQADILSALENKKLAATERERLRLLYVAMTRAENWLIICGTEEAEERGQSWYSLACAGMNRLETSEIETPAGQGWRFAHGAWPENQPEKPPRENHGQGDLPDWAYRSAPTPKADPGPVLPSDLEGAKVLSGGADALEQEAAMARGSRVHLLLEKLPDQPPETWEQMAEFLLNPSGDTAQAPLVHEALAEARKVLEAPEFAFVFAPGSLAEVELSAQIPAFAPRSISGKIDRLIVSPEKVTVIDFKTNRKIPESPADVPAGIVAQMSAYSQAVARIYPQREVEAIVIWTAGPVAMPLPATILRTPLVAPAQLDLNTPEP